MASIAVHKNGSVLLSPSERGIMVQPSRAATGYEVVQVSHGCRYWEWAQLDTVDNHKGRQQW